MFAVMLAMSKLPHSHTTTTYYGHIRPALQQHIIVLHAFSHDVTVCYNRVCSPRKTPSSNTCSSFVPRRLSRRTRRRTST